MGHPGDDHVPALRGDAEQVGGRPVGERVVRRVEAALDTHRGRMLAASDPKRSEAERAQAHPAPNPYQALGLVGRG